MPEDTTITAVIGEQLRAIEAAKCIGRSISTGCSPVWAATAGVRAAKAKNGAFAAAHNDSREGDDSDHNEHHSHRAKAKALTAGDQRIDSTHDRRP